MKDQVSELAVLGGSPLFRQPVHVGQPNVVDADRLANRIADVIKSGHLTNNGPQVRDFEAEIAHRCHVKHCVAVCNGTMALQIMAKACQLTGEVIVPAFTFIATAHALEWIGLTPVFADVDAETHTLCPESVTSCLSEKTSAILGVHLWGNPCRTQRLQKLADDFGLQLMFDSSHAFGCQVGGRPVGSFGKAEVFSFHATKFVHAFEGGAIVTNDDTIAQRCRNYRNFGISGLSTIDSAGINAKISEVGAAAGLESMDSMEVILQQNRANHNQWSRAVDRLNGLDMISLPPNTVLNRQYVVATIDVDEFGLSRDQLLAILRAEGVFARSYFVPGCHKASPYVGQAIHRRVPLPVTESLLKTVIQFPTGLSVSENQISQTADLLNFIAEHSLEIGLRLQQHSSDLYYHPQDPARPTSQLSEAA